MIRNQIQDLGFLGSYALVPATNELCFRTQVALRATVLTCNEWEHFAANGEDLGTDQTPDVNRQVSMFLLQYRQDALQKLQKIQALPAGVPTALLRSRWTQIVDAIDAFTKMSNGEN